MTLPGHGDSLPSTQALTVWAQEISQGHNPLGTFVDQVSRTIEILTRQGLLIPERLAVAGLSRGAFMAAHVAARIPLFHILLGFAPLTSLKGAKEFAELKEHPLVHSLDLIEHVDALCHRHVRFYIGNADTRVSTKSCLTFIEALVQCATAKQIRSPQIELVMTPSIGHMGHGTSKEIFHQGAAWIAGKLGVEKS